MNCPKCHNELIHKVFNGKVCGVCNNCNSFFRRFCLSVKHLGKLPKTKTLEQRNWRLKKGRKITYGVQE